MKELLPLAEAIRDRREQREAEWAATGATESKQLLSALGLDSMTRVVPESCDLEELRRLTTDSELQDANDRASLCLRCPEEGGACDVPDVSVEPGLRPAWEPGIGLRYRPCSRFAEHFVRRWLRGCGVRQKFLSATLDNFTASDDARDLARLYVMEFSLDSGRGFRLTGNVGTGKTHLAVSIMRALFWDKKISSACFIDVPMFLEQLKSMLDAPGEERRAFLAEIMYRDLLVLDDLGAERTSPFVREQLSLIINERWSSGRPVIVTSNVSLDECEETLGPRSFSRLNSMLPESYVCDWEDQRAPA